MAAYLQDLCPWQCYATLTFSPKSKWWLSPASWREPVIGRGSLRSDDGRERHGEHREPQTNMRRCQEVVALWHQLLCERLLGPKWHRRKGVEGVKAFIPWESQKSGALHVHPLVGSMPSGWRYQDLRECWTEAQRRSVLAPGFSWLRPYAEDEKLRRYVAKYVVKDLDGDGWSLLGWKCAPPGPAEMVLPGRSGGDREVGSRDRLTNVE